MPLFGPNVEKLRKQGEVSQLVQLLGHKDASISDAAQASLISMRDHPNVRNAVFPLSKALEEEGTRGRAMSVLASLGDDEIAQAVDASIGGPLADHALTVYESRLDLKAREEAEIPIESPPLTPN